MPDLALPRLSDTMEEGTIVAWLRNAGEQIAVGEDLVEIETDKATMTCQAEHAGRLTILAEAGETHPVGHPIAWIGDGPRPGAGAGASADAPASPGAATAAGGDAQTAAADGRAAGAAAGSGGRADEAAASVAASGVPVPAADDAAASSVRASPVARRMARQMQIDLAAVAGSGPRGRVLKADVEAHAAPAPAASANGAAAAPVATPSATAPTGMPTTAAAESADRGATTLEPLSGIQRTIARRMVEAKTTAPEFVLAVDVDMTEAVALRAALKQTGGDDPIPSFNDFVVRACALALREFPRANGAYGDDGFRLFARVNVGVAVAADDALVVPTIFDADRKALGRIAEETRALAGRVRDGSIAPAEMSGGTFTVSNLGMLGIDRFVAVLNPPQAAILAVGRMTTQPVWDADQEQFVPRSLLSLSLTCDHRILYGADAARFLGRIRERLEAPLRLAL